MHNDITPRMLRERVKSKREERQQSGISKIDFHQSRHIIRSRKVPLNAFHAL